MASPVILATGARPDYVGSKDSRIVNSAELLETIHPPAHLFFIGARYVGCAFAAIYRAFGCQVILAEKSECLLQRWDENVGAHIAHQLSAAGVELMLDRNIPVYDLPTEEGWPIIGKADGREIRLIFSWWPLAAGLERP